MIVKCQWQSKSLFRCGILSVWQLQRKPLICTKGAGGLSWGGVGGAESLLWVDCPSLYSPPPPPLLESVIAACYRYYWSSWKSLPQLVDCLRHYTPSYTRFYHINDIKHFWQIQKLSKRFLTFSSVMLIINDSLLSALHLSSICINRIYGMQCCHWRIDMSLVLMWIDGMGLGDKRQPRLRPVASTLIIQSSGR